MTGSRWEGKSRLSGLRRFATAITALNVLGHTWFGFEQSWATPLVSLAVAYALELLFESLDATAHARLPRYAGGVRAVVDFLLPAHISALAVAMLLYPGERLWPVAFATAVAMSSKVLFRCGSRHFMNPSNFGIAIALLCLPWVGIAPPYQFTETLDWPGDWLLPVLIVMSGTVLNATVTKRIPLIAAWLCGFVAQALIRGVWSGVPTLPSLLPMTGLAFLLYTFYMVTDPATTPSSGRGQVAFGLSVAATYGALMAFHVVFGLFFALSIVCALRGTMLWAIEWERGRVPMRDDAAAVRATRVGTIA